MAMRRSISVAMLGLLLAACAADQDGYPSLARRPAERVSGTAEPAPTASEVPLPPSSPEQAGRLGQLVAQAQAADAKFQARTDETRRRVGAAANAAMASENWSVATIALAGLESARSEAMVALADLDAMYVADGVAGKDVIAIAAARNQVTALVEQEDAVLAELKVRLRS